MNVLDMTTKWAIMLCSFLASVVLNDSFVFGILPSEYFAYLPIVYGFMGNLLYSIIILLAEWRRQSEGGHDKEKDMNKFGYILLVVQPFAAAFFSFLLTAVIKTMVRSGSIINVEINEGTSLLIGVCSGMFFVYFIKPEYIHRIFKKYINNRILGDDENNNDNGKLGA